MNTCDHGHETSGETRLLPYGGGGNIITCYQHYLTELAWRKERIADGVPYDLPAWDELRRYADD